MKYIFNKKVGLVLLALLTVAQFFPASTENPPHDSSSDFLANANAPENINKLITAACYDCHSNTTSYPWYSGIVPLSYWLRGHIDEGREHLNFSDWGKMEAAEKSHHLKECSEMLEKTEMPLLPYMVMHRDGWISKDERAQLVEWFKEESR